MYQTEKQKNGNLVSWVEYEPATKEPSGNWKSEGIGRIRFKHDDGHTFQAEIVVCDAPAKPLPSTKCSGPLWRNYYLGSRQHRCRQLVGNWVCPPQRSENTFRKMDRGGVPWTWT
jgi:hypothetical protein